VALATCTAFSRSASAMPIGRVLLLGHVDLACCTAVWPPSADGLDVTRLIVMSGDVDVITPGRLFSSAPATFWMCAGIVAVAVDVSIRIESDHLPELADDDVARLLLIS